VVPTQPRSPGCAPRYTGSCENLAASVSSLDPDADSRRKSVPPTPSARRVDQGSPLSRAAASTMGPPRSRTIVERKSAHGRGPRGESTDSKPRESAQLCPTTQDTATSASCPRGATRSSEEPGPRPSRTAPACPARHLRRTLPRRNSYSRRKRALVHRSRLELCGAHQCSNVSYRPAPREDKIKPGSTRHALKGRGA
jgi:hypothetical protein